MGIKSKTYPLEFKLDAIRQITDEGLSVENVASRLGVRPRTLRRWKKSWEKTLREKSMNAEDRVVASAPHVTVGLATHGLENDDEDPLLVRAIEKLEKEIDYKPVEVIERGGRETLAGEPERVIRSHREPDKSWKPLEGSNQSAFAGPQTQPSVPSGTAISPPMSGISVGELLATLADSRWHIARWIFLLCLIGLGYILTAEPVYRVDALLEIKKAAPSTEALAELLRSFKEESVVTEEVEILQSRTLLGQVVDEQKLDFTARPAYFPVIGAGVARINTLIKSLVDPSYVPDILWLNLDGYAWSDEGMNLTVLDVPPAYVGSVFTLVAQGDDRYQLFDEQGALLTEGIVGVRNVKWLPADSPHAILVSELRGDAGTRFEVSRKPRIDAINELLASLLVKEKGQESSVVQVSLEGHDEQKITATVNSIADAFVRQDAEKKTAEIEKSLGAMQEQLATLEQQMGKAEQALGSYRQQKGAVDLTRESQLVLDRMVTLEAELAQLRSKRAELSERFTSRHPDIVAVEAQSATLMKELGAIQAKVKTLPQTQQEVVVKSRDAELYTQLYSFLRNRIEELKVAGAVPPDAMRVLDYAVPTHEPIKPIKALVIAVSVTLGLFVGIFSAFLRKALRGAIQDPEIIEKELGLPVYAVVPHSQRQRRIMKGAKGKKQAILAITESADPAIESLRGLRTSLHFVGHNAHNNVLLVTGPTPEIGKSFLTVNFGVVLASAGKRVLLIDGDLRKGNIHKYLGIKNEKGLSDFIASGADIENAIRKTAIENLDFISGGTRFANPSELLAHPSCKLALEKLSLSYDYVIVDSPPVLLVSDAATIGRLAGTALLVVKAGTHTLREIEQSIKRLKQAGVHVRAVVFNDMPVSRRRYPYGNYYGYAYSYSDKG